MPKTLAFLHTAESHVAAFDLLVAAAGAPVAVRHVVRETLLHEARAEGITPQLERRVGEILLGMFDDGADLVVCTCSTIGGCAERAGRQHGRSVVRVDRAMAERAVELGSRILIAATLGNTLSPTRELLHEIAAAAGKAIEIHELLCDSAWPKFEAGDHAGYEQEIADRLTAAADDVDMIVLAQASMASAAERCADVRAPILSSPRLAVEAALASLSD